MASTGQVVSYGELDARSNRMAHLLRAHGLGRLGHYAIFMENNNRYLEACAGGARAGLYYTCINSYLKAEELAYLLDNSESTLLVTSVSLLALALEALKDAPRVTRCLVVGDGGAPRQHGHVRVEDFAQAVAAYPATPIADEYLGIAMLYSSGTTGRPKGIIRLLPPNRPAEALPVMDFLLGLWRYRDRMVYLSPAPLYHAAPQLAVDLSLRSGGTVVVMEHFDPEEYLALVERYRVTHSQLVPTMFSRMLKLPEAARRRHDLSSLEFTVHAAAPCPPQVKRQMIDWWGPIVHEYYGATEGLGFTAVDSHEWLAHPGTVGRVLMGDLHILDETLQPVPTGTAGQVWFKTASPFEYFNDLEKTRAAQSPDGSMSTVGDVGHVDDEGYLYLTDRASFMLISGGVNLYPQECENLLISHPKVADAAVFGVPNEDLGEAVKAVVQAMPGIETGPALAAELIDYCNAHLARQKVPRSIDFSLELPRLPTGKLYKRVLRDAYWKDHGNKLV